MKNLNDTRRPIKTRNTNWAVKLACVLNNIGITPNQISIMSIFIACVTGGALLLVNYTSYSILKVILMLIAAGFIQLRLLCNLMDGMVAVEHNQASKVGFIYNDLPDRFADTIIFLSCGYFANHYNSLGITLGWICSLLAIGTAYIRLLGASAGTKQFFAGPMAKPHRMALLTFVLLLSIIEFYFWTIGLLMFYTLIIIIAGSIVTIYHRLSFIVKELK